MTSISKPSFFLFSVFVFIISLLISSNTETKTAISIFVSQIFKIIRFNLVNLNLNNQSVSSTSDSSVPNRCVIWTATLISDGGYCSETWSHVLAAINNTNKNDNFSLRFGQHVDIILVFKEFHVSSFVKNEVDPSKVVKLIEAIDIEFFNPIKYRPLNLSSLGNLVLGSGSPGLNSGSPSVFMSVFKWEYRKDWDVLLQSYLKEFDSLDGVGLYLLSNPYHSDSYFGNKIVKYVEDSGLEKPSKGWAPVYVIDSHIAQRDFPKLHKTADAFIFPSRGERWGRPIVETMAISSPSFATNGSGLTERLTKNNSYPQSADRINEFMDWPFKGHFRAEPSIKLSNEIAANIVPKICVTWMAPFISGGGYCSEAWSYVLALNQFNKNSNFRLRVEQYGDNENGIFWDGLPLNIKKLAYKLYQTECRFNESVVIFHSEPGAWNPPLFQTTTFLPVNNRFSVGRTMFETDRVNPEHVKRCNAMDMVWVPSEFHVSSFVKSGVDPSKIVKVVQAIDTEFFDPIKHSPLDLSSIGNLVIGSGSKSPFLFLSVFKWEYRKGWDVLLQSYLKEFDSLDGVCLYMLTNPYNSDSDFGNKIVEFVKNSGLEKPVNGWAPVYVIDSHIAQVELPRLYKAADGFVLPSRGEGWGRPIVEAMAMSLPVIATNWSGPTEYLTEKNSFPLGFDRMSEVIDGPFKGHLWAEPSVDKLKFLMRRVMSNAEEAKSKGKKAREDMIDKFSPAIVADIVSDQIKRILDKLA